jgi:ribosomal protein L37E
MKKNNQPLVNCDLCGRDTRNKCKVCVHCLGGRTEQPRTADDIEMDEVRERLYGPDSYTRDGDIDSIVQDAIDDMLN